MKENYLEELIDALLRGTIKDEDRSRLESMMEHDPGVAKVVRESRETYRFLQYARYQQIKTRLRKFDENEIHSLKRLPFRRWAFAVVIFLVLLASGWLWLMNYFKPENLANRNFENISGAELTQGTALRDEILYWDLANVLFAKGEFQNAASQYIIYTENPQSTFYMNAKWNLLMCQLAMDGPTLQWHENLAQFISIEVNPLEAKARQLSQLLGTIFYKWGVQKPASLFSALKPRLI